MHLYNAHHQHHRQSFDRQTHYTPSRPRSQIRNPSSHNETLRNGAYQSIDRNHARMCSSLQMSTIRCRHQYSKFTPEIFFFRGPVQVPALPDPCIILVQCNAMHEKHVLEIACFCGGLSSSERTCDRNRCANSSESSFWYRAELSTIIASLVQAQGEHCMKLRPSVYQDRHASGRSHPCFFGLTSYPCMLYHLLTSDPRRKKYFSSVERLRIAQESAAQKRRRQPQQGSEPWSPTRASMEQVSSSLGALASYIMLTLFSSAEYYIIFRCTPACRC
jgi:hypothetical protein